MLSRTLRVTSVRTLRNPLVLRTITTAPLLRQDSIQELYLRELRNYKPKPPSAEEAEAQTKTWRNPKQPKIPDTSSAPVEEISSYASESVDVTPRAGDEKYEHDFEEVFESWFDEPDSEARMREENPTWEKRQRRIFPPPPPRPQAYKSRSQRSRTGAD